MKYLLHSILVCLLFVNELSGQETTYFDKEENSREADWKRGLFHRLIWTKAHQEETNSMLYVSGFGTWGTLVSKQNINPVEFRIAKEQRIRNSPFSVDLALDMAFRFRNEANTFSNVSLLAKWSISPSKKFNGAGINRQILSFSNEQDEFGEHESRILRLLPFCWHKELVELER